MELEEKKEVKRTQANIEGEQKGESDLDVLAEFSEPIGFLILLNLKDF